VRGLHDHRHVDAVLAQARQHAEAVEIGHDEIEHDAVAALGAGQLSDGLIAALGKHRLVAELAHHVVEQTTLDRIIVDDENTRDHGIPRTQLCRFDAPCTGLP
jgi:hypothetical protein